ncbi:MAG: hypothetical protein ABI543_11925 [Ignavibacteria bacterium]
MEPPVSYPQSDSFQGKKIYGKKSGCASKGCFGIIGAVFLLVVIGVIGYFFAVPAIMPNHISGDFLDAVIVPTKDGKQNLWILTDGSFNFIMEKSSPGSHSVGRECYLCKTYTYILDTKNQDVLKKIKTPYEDIITKIDMLYVDGKVWEFTSDYGENEPKIEAFDPDTGDKLMDTKQFIAKYPVLSSGLSKSYYDKKEGTLRIETKDGKQGVIYHIATEKLYPEYKDLMEVQRKDSTPTYLAVLSPENSSSQARKLLYLVSGPRANLLDHGSSLDNFVKNDDNLKYYGLDARPLGEKIYLEGIIYHQDKDCAIIIYLDKLGKKSNRLMTCVDLKTGKEKWTVDNDVLFKRMRIDEEDDTFSSLFFTKDNIDVKRAGELVILQLKGYGIMAIDFSTGKKLWDKDI